MLGITIFFYYIIQILFTTTPFINENSSNRNKNCLDKFQDYHFIPASTSLKAGRCIYSLNAEKFDQICPEKQLIMTDKHSALHLKLKSEATEGENVIFSRELTYNVDSSTGNEVNIAEQLEIKVNASFVMPWDRILLQVLHSDSNLTQYGFLFHVQKQFKKLPDLVALFGYVIVPTSSFNQSLVLNEEQYRKYSKDAADMEKQSKMLGDNLQTLWKGACERH